MHYRMESDPHCNDTQGEKAKHLRQFDIQHPAHRAFPFSKDGVISPSLNRHQQTPPSFSTNARLYRDARAPARRCA